MKNKRIGLMVAIFGVLMLTFGITYSFVSLTRVGKNNNMLIAGDIYMHYNETNVLTLDNAVPRKEYDPNSYFEFTIDGKNEYTKKDIWYDITLTYGDVVAGKKTRINDDLLKFRLVENRTGEEKVLFDNKSFQTINNKKIWVDKIEKDTGEEIKITYKLYMWIGEETSVGNLDTNDYKQEEWNNDVYASIKVNVSGDFVEKTLDNKTMIEELKEKAYNNGEMIAIDNDSNKCESISSCEIREYRYSGVKANNYVELTDNEENGELWRIIGVFKEDGEEYVKLVRNEVLPRSVIPNDYVINETTYKISTNYNLYPEAVYWNYIDGVTDKNDWSKAGLQYYLNTEQDSKGTKGYLSYLSEDTKSMLREKTTYYLGSVNNDSTVKKAFQDERNISGCVNGIGPEENNNQEAIQSNETCSVWTGNQTIWTGKIGLPYISDFAFMLDSSYWTKNINTTAGLPSWLRETSKDAKDVSSWSITPATVDYNMAMQLSYGGWASAGLFADSWTTSIRMSIRPSIALKSNVKIVSGNGRETNPYKLALS